MGKPAGRRATPVSASIWKRLLSAAASNTRAPWLRQPTLRAARACFERPTAHLLCAFAYGRRNHPSSNATSMPRSAAIASATASFQAGRERAEPTRQHPSNAVIVISLAQALFAPRSVAIVGQSEDPGKAAGRPLRFLRQMGYAGRVYPINPRRAQVLGERAWPSLSTLPEVPEHAYVVTPTDGAIESVEECARLGVPVATVLADGFAEAGEEGLAREARLRDTCARTGIRIVGPSSLGVVDLRSKAMLTANAAFDAASLPLGRIFIASHSGSMIGALATRGSARGLGFSGLVSVGNEIDLSLGEICAATLEDPDIDAYMLFLETMRHADALRGFALKAAERGKPVIA